MVINTPHRSLQLDEAIAAINMAKGAIENACRAIAIDLNRSHWRVIQQIAQLHHELEAVRLELKATRLAGPAIGRKRRGRRRRGRR